MDLKELCLIRGVSGHEQEIRKALMEACRPLCTCVTIDRMGNVAAFKKGTNKDMPHVLLAAHMDEVGFIVTSASDEGLLRIRPVGGVDPRVVISKRVLVGDKAVPGVIGAMAIHLQSPDDRKKVLQYDSIYVDIGAKNKEEALSDCPQGSYITFDTPYTPFGGGFVCAKALDDRVGCLSLLKVLEDTYPGDVTCLFTTEEEVGCRGAAGGTFKVAPDMALVLEGTTCNDMGDVKETMQVCRAGEGVAISFMDNASLVNRPLYEAILRTARENNIPHQIKRSVSGGNDSGAIHKSRGGVATCVLSVPCRYIHGPSSVVKESDVEAQYRLAHDFLKHPKV
jgi:putative aminopeptidase FrvX